MIICVKAVKLLQLLGQEKVIAITDNGENEIWLQYRRTLDY